MEWYKSADSLEAFVGHFQSWAKLEFCFTEAMNVWVADRPFSLSAITAWQLGLLDGLPTKKKCGRCLYAQIRKREA